MTMNKEQEEEFDKVWRESMVSSRSSIALEGKAVKQFINELLENGKCPQCGSDSIMHVQNH